MYVLKRAQKRENRESRVCVGLGPAAYLNLSASSAFRAGVRRRSPSRIPRAPERQRARFRFRALARLLIAAALERGAARGCLPRAIQV
jgi:hypothetical protein